MSTSSPSMKRADRHVGTTLIAHNTCAVCSQVQEVPNNIGMTGRTARYPRLWPLSGSNDMHSYLQLPTLQLDKPSHVLLPKTDLGCKLAFQGPHSTANVNSSQASHKAPPGQQGRLTPPNLLAVQPECSPASQWPNASHHHHGQPSMLAITGPSPTVDRQAQQQ